MAAISKIFGATWYDTRIQIFARSVFVMEHSADACPSLLSNVESDETDCQDLCQTLQILFFGMINTLGQTKRIHIVFIHRKELAY